MENTIGYTFRNKFLLCEALTHSSATTRWSNYQRLEFLGDSLLDALLVSSFLKSHSGATAGDLHNFKSACVNNYFLGRICIQLKLNRCIHHQSAALLNMLAAAEAHYKSPGDDKVLRTHTQPYVYSINWLCSLSLVCGVIFMTLKRGGGFKLLLTHCKDALPHWLDEPTSLVHVAKVLGDVLEAVVGAIFVDSESLSTCETFLRKHLPVWHLSPTTVPRNPHAQYIEKISSLFYTDKIVRFKPLGFSLLLQ